MKNSILFSSLLITLFFFSSFRISSQSDKALILQSVMQEQIFQKFIGEEKTEIAIYTGSLIDADSRLMWEGKSVDILDAPRTGSKKGQKYVELEELKVKGKKAMLTLVCEEKVMKVKYKKIDGQWQKRKISVKGNGTFIVDATF